MKTHELSDQDTADGHDDLPISAGVKLSSVFELSDVVNKDLVCIDDDLSPQCRLA